MRESKCNLVAFFVTQTREQKANLTCMSALVDYTVELPSTCKVANHCISNGRLCNNPLQGYVSTVLINIYRGSLIYKYIYVYQSHTHKTLSEYISSTDKKCICNNNITVLHILRPLFENHIQNIMQKSFKL